MTQDTRTARADAPPGAPEKFYPALDGLRAIAIGGVMALHYLVRTPVLPTVAGQGLHALEIFGTYGVDLFFVLSGFLITGILLDSRESASYFKTFYIRRVLRIFPLYYAALVVLGVIMPAVWPSAFDWSPAGHMSLGWFWSYLSNWPLAIRGWGASPQPLSHFWTLAIEEQFYLVWPAVVLLVPPRWLGKLCAVILAAAVFTRAALVYRWPVFGLIEVATVTRMDGLILGALVALWWHSPDARRRWSVWVWPIFGASVAAFGALIVWRGMVRLSDNAWLIVGLPVIVTMFAALLAATLLGDARSWLVRGLSWAPLRYIGRRSYGLYVLHYPVLTALNALGLRMDVLQPRLHSTAIAEATIAIVNSAAAIGVAALSWRFLEKPFLRLKEHFPYGRTPARAIDAAATAATSPAAVP